MGLKYDMNIKQPGIGQIPAENVFIYLFIIELLSVCLKGRVTESVGEIQSIPSADSFLKWL